MLQILSFSTDQLRNTYLSAKFSVIIKIKRRFLQKTGHKLIFTLFLKNTFVISTVSYYYVLISLFRVTVKSCSQLVYRRNPTLILLGSTRSK